MRYSSHSEETSIWIVLSALWAVASVLAWGAAFSNSTESTTASGDVLVLLAVLLVGISLALRSPILSDVPATTCFTNQLVWLLTTAANINWLGYCGLRAESLIDIGPVALLLITGEVWTYRKVNRQACLPVVDSILLSLQSPWKKSPDSALADPLDTGNSSVGRASVSVEASAAFDTAGTADIETAVAMVATAVNQPELTELTDSHAEPKYLRQTFDGIDESGERYLSGEIRVEFEVGQVTESIVVAFSPPFAGTPEVQFELEPVPSQTADSPVGAAAQLIEDVDEAELETRLTNCTPIGMRVGLRRAAADSKRSQTYVLGWYAAIPRGNTGCATADTGAAPRQAANSPLP